MDNKEEMLQWLIKASRDEINGFVKNMSRKELETMFQRALLKLRTI